MDEEQGRIPLCWIPFVGPAIAAWQSRLRPSTGSQTLARRRALRWVIIWAIAHTLLSLGSQQAGGVWHLRFLYLDGLTTTVYLSACLIALWQWRRSRQTS
ncbi:MAG: hypothetical protein AAFY11_00230 [Cyanobacteria bacterium J06641_5]